MYFYFLGDCSCKRNTVVDAIIKPGQRKALVYWRKPGYDCVSGGEVTYEQIFVQPDLTSPHFFSRGNHMITYTYTLNGGDSFECLVKIEVKGELNNHELQTHKSK